MTEFPREIIRQVNNIPFKFNPQAENFEASLICGLNPAPKPGESPRYDSRSGKLFMVGIENKGLYVLDRGMGNFECIKLPFRAGMLALTSDPNKLLLAAEGDLVLYDLTQRSFKKLCSLETGSNIRLNDGDVLEFQNPEHPLNGKIVVGGISESSPRQAVASLFAVASDGKVETLIKGGITNSNGLGTVGNQLLHTDTGTGRISFYNYSSFRYPALSLTKAIDFSQLRANDSLLKDKVPVPDGLVVGKYFGRKEDGGEDLLLVALYRAGKVVGITPEGEHLLTVNVPAPETASVELIGDFVVVTTGSGGGEAFPQAGGVFAVRVPGLISRPRGIFKLQ